jgi:hypothetical protein
MRPSERNVNFGLWVPIGLLITSIMTAIAWGGERPAPTGSVAFGQPVLQQDFLNPNWLDYSKFSGSDRKFASPSPPSRKKGLGFDFKTDYDVDLEKFLPPDGFPLHGLMANGNQQSVSTQKKKPSFLGLSVSKPLN